MNQWVGDVRKRAPYRVTKKIQKTIVTREDLTGPSEGRKKTQREQVYRDAHTSRHMSLRALVFVFTEYFPAQSKLNIPFGSCGASLSRRVKYCTVQFTVFTCL